MGRIVLDPVTRIEGHRRIDTPVENGHVVEGWARGEMFRGSEALLRRARFAIQKETDVAISSVKTGLDEVTRSSERSRRAGQALREIVGKIGQNSEMVSHIAAATQQQSAALSEISRNLDSIAKLAGEVVSSVWQTSVTADRLG